MTAVGLTYVFFIESCASPPWDGMLDSHAAKVYGTVHASILSSGVGLSCVFWISRLAVLPNTFSAR